MVKKIFTILNRESGGINEAAFLLAFFAFLSQLLSLFRDRSLAHFLGPSSNLDVYYAAFRVPDFLYAAVSSLVSITVLLPFLIQKLEKHRDGDREAHSLYNDIFTAFIYGMTLICVIAFIFMPEIAKLIAPGFTGEQTKTLIEISRLMLLSPLFLG